MSTLSLALSCTSQKKKNSSPQPTYLHLKLLFCPPSCNNGKSISSSYLQSVILVVSKNFPPAVIPFYPYPVLYISPTLLSHSHGYLNMTLRNLSLPTHFPPATISFVCSRFQQNFFLLPQPPLVSIPATVPKGSICYCLNIPSFLKHCFL